MEQTDADQPITGGGNSGIYFQRGIVATGSAKLNVDRTIFPFLTIDGLTDRMTSFGSLAPNPATSAITTNSSTVSNLLGFIKTSTYERTFTSTAVVDVNDANTGVGSSERLGGQILTKDGSQVLKPKVAIFANIPEIVIPLKINNAGQILVTTRPACQTQSDPFAPSICSYASSKLYLLTPQ